MCICVRIHVLVFYEKRSALVQSTSISYICIVRSPVSEQESRPGARAPEGRRSRKEGSGGPSIRRASFRPPMGDCISPTRSTARASLRRHFVKMQKMPMPMKVQSLCVTLHIFLILLRKSHKVGYIRAACRVFIASGQRLQKFAICQ